MQLRDVDPGNATVMARNARQLLAVSAAAREKARVPAGVLSATAAQLAPANSEVLWRRVAVLALTDQAEPARELADHCPAPTDAWAWEARWDACRLLGRRNEAAEAEKNATTAASAGAPDLGKSMADTLTLIRRTAAEPGGL